MTLVYAIASAFFFALTFLFRKQAAKFLPLTVALTIEAIVEVLLLFLFVSLSSDFKKPLAFSNSGILLAVLAGLCVTLGVFFNISSLKTGTLSKIVGITSPSQIVFGVLLGVFLLKDYLTGFQMAGVIVTIAGILMVMH